MRLNGRIQIFSKCGHYLGGHRACPSDSQEAILARARSISELRVSQADLGPSTPVERCQGVHHKHSPARIRAGIPISFACNAPVPLKDWFRTSTCFLSNLPESCSLQSKPEHDGAQRGTTEPSNLPHLTVYRDDRLQ